MELKCEKWKGAGCAVVTICNSEDLICNVCTELTAHSRIIVLVPTSLIQLREEGDVGLFKYASPQSFIITFGITP